MIIYAVWQINSVNFALGEVGEVDWVSSSCQRLSLSGNNPIFIYVCMYVCVCYYIGKILSHIFEGGGGSQRHGK